MENEELQGFDDEVVDNTPVENDGFDDETPVEDATENEEQDTDTQEETSTDDEVVEEEGAEPTSEADKTETMELNILGDVKNYSLEEVKALAQKGGDYDRVKGKNEELKEELQAIKDELKLYGINDLDTLIQNRINSEIQAEIDAGVPEDKARELVENRHAKLQEQKAKTKADKEMEAKTKEQEELREFIEAYPNVKPEEVPQEVWKLAKEKGISPTDAMNRLENQRLQKEIAQLKQNLENQKKAPIKGVTQHGASTPKKVDKDLIGWDDED